MIIVTRYSDTSVIILQRMSSHKPFFLQNHIFLELLIFLEARKCNQIVLETYALIIQINPILDIGDEIESLN